MRLHLIFAAVVSMLIVGCSSSTVYQPAEKRGGYGYTETELSSDRYRVTFTGNSITDKETVNDYAMLRASELTLQNGYNWFQIVNRDIEGKSRTTNSVSAINDFGGRTSVYQRCGMISCDTVVYQQPSRLSGGVSSSATRTNYQASLEIKVGKFPMPDDVEAYNAQDMASTLRRWVGQRAR
jgi:hypothetical protein